MKLVVATRNINKLKEIRAILSPFGVELLSLDNFPQLEPVIEDGRTFMSNAIKKAVTVALATRNWVLADDSGLEVYSLNGAPGVMSSRYAGREGDDKANIEKLLKEMEGESLRHARFVCVIALSSPSGRAQIVEGVCEGRITTEPIGTNGFGYDPVFIPDGYDQTFAEMPSELKNTISHRARGLMAAVEKWGYIFAQREVKDFF